MSFLVLVDVIVKPVIMGSYTLAHTLGNQIREH